MPKPKSLANLCAVLLMAAVFSAAHAEDLKSIIQQAKDGQQAAALERINTYIGANPKDVQALFLRGVIQAELGKRDDAIKTFTDMTEKYPSLPEPYNNLAVLYADQGQYDKARQALETAIKTHPSYATAHENLGDLYARMASEAYDKALQLDSSNSRAQNKLAMIKDLGSASAKSAVAAASVAPTTAVTKPTVVADAAKEVAKTDTKPANSVPLPIRPAEGKVKPADVKPVEATKPSVPVEPVVVQEKPKEPPVQADTFNKDDVEKAVKQWAEAWSNKDVNKYLDSYAKSFTPPDGLSRAEWENMRKERIMKPVKISVEVGNLQVESENQTTAKASFRQSYRAGGSPMRTSKVLLMKKVDGKWLINAENAGGK